VPSTPRRWLADVRSYAEITAQALDAYDQLAEAGVSAPVTEAPVYLAFGRPEQAAPARHELDVLTDHGLRYKVSFDPCR
jgi:D-amino-acid dehydrogenase